MENTTSPSTFAKNDPAFARPKAGINHFAATGALTALAFFALCWAAAALGIPASHLFVSLFTAAPAASLEALWTGGICALVAGGLAGALIAIFYNLTVSKR